MVDAGLIITGPSLSVGSTSEIVFEEKVSEVPIIRGSGLIKVVAGASVMESRVRESAPGGIRCFGGALRRLCSVGTALGRVPIRAGGLHPARSEICTSRLRKETCRLGENLTRPTVIIGAKGE